MGSKLGLKRRAIEDKKRLSLVIDLSKVRTSSIQDVKVFFCPLDKEERLAEILFCA